MTTFRSGSHDRPLTGADRFSDADGGESVVRLQEVNDSALCGLTPRVLFQHHNRPHPGHTQRPGKSPLIASARLHRIARIPGMVDVCVPITLTQSELDN